MLRSVLAAASAAAALLAVPLPGVNAACELRTCAAGVSSTTGNCYTDYATAKDCLQSIQFNETWRTNTLDTLLSSLENYSLKDITRNSGPPFNVQSTALDQLAAARTRNFATDWDFQEYIQQALASLHDAHTRWTKPSCYDAIEVMPFALHISLVTSPSPVSSSVSAGALQFTLQPSVYNGSYVAQFPALAATLQQLNGAQLLFVDDVDTTAAIASWSQLYETKSNDNAILFNAAVRTFLYRSQLSTVLSTNDSLTFTVALPNSQTIMKVKLPWLVTYSSLFAKVSACLLPPTPTPTPSPTPSPTTPSPTHNLDLVDHDRPHYNNRPMGIIHPDAPTPQVDEHVLITHFNSNNKKQQKQEKKPSFSVQSTTSTVTVSSSSAAAASQRTWIISSTATNSSIYCFLQFNNDANTNGKIVLVMKVGSFAPDGFYRNAWYGFIRDAIKCLSASPASYAPSLTSASTYDALVLDVQQNGGGYVCLGLRFLTLLFDYFHDDPKRLQYPYELPHSPFMDEYIRVFNHNQPYIDPQAVEEIMDPTTQTVYPDGRSYYYPGHNRTSGGRTTTFTNTFALDCHEAYNMFPTFVPPRQLNNPNIGGSKTAITIITDGTCGSTCATFTKLAQEANVVTFVGVGGNWNGPDPAPMDVSSFAGGFVCNPGYLATMANLSKQAPFPQFVTSARWQFTWSVWFSERQPDRPIQFTTQPADLRAPWWDFQHPSVPTPVWSAQLSSLWDANVNQVLQRVATAEAAHNAASSSDGKHAWRTAFIVITVLLGVLILVLACWLHRMYRTAEYANKSGSYLSTADA